jgi:hypothetical protein
MLLGGCPRTAHQGSEGLQSPKFNKKLMEDISII